MSKKSVILGGLIIVGLVGAVGVGSCFEKIPAGYVGVQYSMKGGIKDEVLTQGWKFVSPTTKVTKYSVATEQLYMCADQKGDSKDNESFDVICRDGKMNVDFEMSYTFNPDDVTAVYSKYRGMNGKDIMDTIVKGKIKTKVSEVTSKYSVLDAYMNKKSELNADITNVLKGYLKEFGVTVESANITRASVDPAVQKAITDRSTVAQQLEVEKMNQQKAKLQSETNLITAEGKNKLMIENAKAESEKIKIQTQADAQRYKEISASITPELLKKWELDARKEHGWVTIMGGTPIVDTTSK